MADPTPTPAQATPAIDPNLLVPVRVNHETRMEPVSKLISSYQIQSAAEEKLKQANKVLQEHQTAIRDGQSWQQFQADLARNPEEAISELKRYIETRTGRPINLGNQQNTATDDGTEPASPTTHTDPRIRILERKIAELQTAHTSDRTRGAITEALTGTAGYDLFRNSEAARRQGERFLAAAIAANPSAPLDELASQVHADLLEVGGAQAQATYNQRLSTQAATATVPASGGTPTQTDQPPKATVAEWRTNRKAAVERINQHLQTMVNGTRSGR